MEDGIVFIIAWFSFGCFAAVIGFFAVMIFDLKGMDKMEVHDFEKKIQAVKEEIGLWPDGKLKEKALLYINEKKYGLLNGILKNPPGSEVSMKDGTNYLIDRNGTWARLK
ncbi:MAG: hypothetical protein HQK96_06955 [Nitrospirae bacterium]|nr:hypothetical protein [Nitrospirota bacterium]